MKPSLSITTRFILSSCLYLVQHAMSPLCLRCVGRSAGALLCASCVTGLPRRFNPLCGTCAAPITAGSRCSASLSDPPTYSHVCTPFAYAFPADALVQALEYRGMLAIAPLLGDAIAGSPDDRPGIIVPKPLSEARLRERGFNQAQEIARHVAKLTGLPLMPRACRKARDTQPQAALPWKERAKNMLKAFVCDEDFSGTHVAVNNDVMTTGATLNELARSLQQAGAARVSGLIFTRMFPDAFRRRRQHV